MVDWPAVAGLRLSWCTGADREALNQVILSVPGQLSLEGGCAGQAIAMERRIRETGELVRLSRATHWFRVRSWLPAEEEWNRFLAQ